MGALRTVRTRVRLLNPAEAPPGATPVSYGDGLTVAASEVSVDFGTGHNQVARGDAAGTIPDGSITKEKLANGAVSADQLEDGAVSGAKLNSGDAIALRAALGLGDAAVRNTGIAPTNVVLGNDTRLSDARTPTTHAHSVSDITDAGAAGVAVVRAATPSEARAAVALETRYDSLVDDGGWELVSVASSGQASIATGDARLTQPASPATTGDDGRAAVRRSLAALADPLAFDLRVRLVSLTGGNAGTAALLILSSGSDELRLWVETTGTVKLGVSNTSWTELVSVSASFPLTGTGWLRIRYEDREVRAYYGVGSGFAAPTRWTRIYKGDVAQSGGVYGWTNFGVYLTQFGAGAGITTIATWDSISVLGKGFAP